MHTLHSCYLVTYCTNILACHDLSFPHAMHCGMVPKTVVMVFDANRHWADTLLGLAVQTLAFAFSFAFPTPHLRRAKRSAPDGMEEAKGPVSSILRPVQPVYRISNTDAISRRAERCAWQRGWLHLNWGAKNGLINGGSCRILVSGCSRSGKTAQLI